MSPAGAHAQLDHVLVVDDGSTDATDAEAREAGVEVIRHPVNQGKGAAIKTGLSALSRTSGVEYVLVLDGDGQHLPEEIPRFLDAANRARARDLLVGDRMSDTRGDAAGPATDEPLHVVANQPRVRAADARYAMRLSHDSPRPRRGAHVRCESSKYDFETEMLVVAARRGGKIAAVPVSTVYGDEVSKIHPVRDTVRFLQLMRRLKRSAASVCGAAGAPSVEHGRVSGCPL